MNAGEGGRPLVAGSTPRCRGRERAQAVFRRSLIVARVLSSPVRVVVGLVVSVRARGRDVEGRRRREADRERVRLPA